MKNLKKLVPIIAVVLGLAIFFGASAFKASQKTGTQYFKYTGTTFNETNYRNINNWEHVVDLEEPTCGGTENICVLKVDDANLTASGTMLDKLDDFFNNDLATSNAVNNYVIDPANIEAQQN